MGEGYFSLVVNFFTVVGYAGVFLVGLDYFEHFFFCDVAIVILGKKGEGGVLERFL